MNWLQAACGFSGQLLLESGLACISSVHTAMGQEKVHCELGCIQLLIL